MFSGAKKTSKKKLLTLYQTKPNNLWVIDSDKNFEVFPPRKGVAVEKTRK